MKAVRLFEYGEVSVLRYGDYPRPACGQRDVLVRVLAKTISNVDLKFRRGDMAHVRLPGRGAFTSPMQLGRDTGIVERQCAGDAQQQRLGSVCRRPPAFAGGDPTCDRGDHAAIDDRGGA
jgi:NADPH:quinone reductase-like Zn-dependent oxidoreductase